MSSTRWEPHEVMKDDVASYPLVAVAIDRDKGSQNALKWAVDNLCQRGQTITLVHVNTKFSSTSKNQEDSATGYKMPTDPQMRELFLPFRCFCTRKDIYCRDIVLEETDVAKAVVEFVTSSAIEKLVVGAPSRGGFVRFKSTDISNSISKGAPDFCTVYVISKGKVSSMRNAVRPAPAVSPFRAQIQNQVIPTPMPVPTIPKPETTDQHRFLTAKGGAVSEPYMSHDESIMSPFQRGSRGPNARSYTELSFTDSDVSYVSSGRPSIDRMYPLRLSGMSSASDSFEMGQTPKRSMDSSYSTGNEFSSYSSKSSYSQSSNGTGTSWSSNTLIEVLSCIRHPNMVLLLGACPEYGCLVYEYMANGSLEDRLFRKGGSPVIPWQHRFRIAAEIASGLLFLHQTKPEPLVHRDLKPANILLDRNYVSKISDVGLARLVPPSVADNVTQYLMTSTAGTFCYIDPEYQQTGMLGVKSDIYSLGIMLLQIITAKAPMGLTHIVSRSIEKGTFHEVLDQEVNDWPVEEALVLAKMALQCAELRRKDRPDLATVVLPELDRLRSLGEDSIQDCMLRTSTQFPHVQSSFPGI